MRKVQLCFFLFFTTGIFVSCKSPEYFIYSPSPPVNPFFKQKGDSKISAYVSAASGTREEPGIDLQAAYAITNHLAVTGSFFYRKERDEYSNWHWFRPTPGENDSVVNRYHRRMGEIGMGYFTAINSKKTIIFNLYAG